MKTNVIVKLQVEGLHHWPDAAKVFPEVGFLADIHRHILKINIMTILHAVCYLAQRVVKC